MRLSPAVVRGLVCMVVLGAACSPASRSAGPPEIPATTATHATVRQLITAAGDVQAPAQIGVQPQASGRVQQLLVDVGSEVRAGDVLARLETDAPRLAVLQARATLAAAQARLDLINAGARPDDVAQAAEGLAQQQARLASMESQGRPEDMAAAQVALDAQQARLNLLLRGARPEAIQQAQSQLDAAQQKLALLQKGATDDVRQAAVSAVNADTAAVVAAEAQDAALGGTSAADLQSLQSQVDTLGAQVDAAQSAVGSADAALANQKPASQADVQAAQTAFDQAQASLTAATAALSQLNAPPQASIAQAEAALESAAAQRAAAQANQTALEQKVAGVCAPLLNPLSGQSYAPTNSTACGQAKAAADAAVQAGNAAVDAAQGQLDLLRRGGAPATQASLQAQVTSAQALVAATRARLEALRTTGVDAQRAQIQSQKHQALSQLTTAQESLRAAEARLRATRDGTLDAQRKAIRSQTEAARARLTADQAHLEQLVAGPQDEEVQAAQDAVDQAAQQLALVSQPVTQPEIAAQQALVEQAHQQLLKAQRPYTGSDIAQQQHVVAQAEAALRARANPYTNQDLAAARAQLDQAQVGLQQAQLALDQTEVRAPVDGSVSDRQINPGALVVPQTTILTLMPPALEVEVHVDQARLGDIKPGQTAQLHLTAYPEQVFTGKVRTVAPALDSKTRTASVQIEPIDPSHQLKPGMQAMVTVVRAKSDALVVPREAVLGSLLAGAEAIVVAIENSHAERRPVRIGVVDDQVAEITSGLQEGDVVAASNAGGINNGDAVTPRLLAAREPSGASGQ